jgi:hypothetical protein
MTHSFRRDDVREDFWPEHQSKATYAVVWVSMAEDKEICMQQQWFADFVGFVHYCIMPMKRFHPVCYRLKLDYVPTPA